MNIESGSIAKRLLFLCVLLSCRGPATSPPAGGDAKTAAVVEKKEALPPPPAASPAAAADKPLGVTLEALGSLDVKKVPEPGLYALDAEAAAPDGFAPSSQPSAARDDDLLTAWTCTPEAGGKTCALKLVFPEPAKVLLVRIFASSASSKKSFQDHGRAKVLRLHTDAGWAEAEIKDGWDFRHVRFESPVTTKSLTVEIREVYAGKSDGEVFVAELEAFGLSGGRRPPLEIDPCGTVTRFDSIQWGSGGGDSTNIHASPSWIEIVDGEGGARRLLRGTFLTGRKGDRYLLVEDVISAACAGAGLDYKGAYTLVDLQTRLFYDVGPLGGIGAVFRRGDGDGFATSAMNEMGAESVGAVIVEDGRLKKKKGEVEDSFQADELIESWGFPSKADYGCGPTRSGDLPKICSPMKKKDALSAVGTIPGEAWKTIAESDVEDDWSECTPGGGLRVILSLIDECNEVPNALVVIDKSGKVRDSLTTTNVRVGLLRGGTILIEVERKGGAGADIYTVDPKGGLEKTYPNAAFTIGIPPACRCSA
jgi:hypothetical protein